MRQTKSGVFCAHQLSPTDLDLCNLIVFPLKRVTQTASLALPLLQPPDWIPHNPRYEISQRQKSGVVGSEISTHSSSMSWNHSRVFVTNHKNKLKYRDLVAKWAAMMRLISPEKSKAKDRLNIVGLMIYLEANEEAKETIKQSKTVGTLMLEESECDQGREELSTAILDLIATKFSTEKI